MRDDIAEEFFRNNVKMEKNKIQFFYIEFNGAWVEIHLRVSSSENYITLSDATGCPDWSKNLDRGVFQHAESANLLSDLLPDHSSYKSFKKSLSFAFLSNIAWR